MLVKATAIATALADVVERQRLYTVINGKKYPQVEAWMTIWRMDDGGPSLLLERMLRRQSDAAATHALGSESRQFAVAVRRCLSCNQAAQCHAWLASGAKQGYETFCPNAGYVERMKELAS